mgnify:CR=1 FL=1
MLSILIPTYNYNCLSIVSELQSQCTKSGILYEILVQDDASNSLINNENEKINLLENCRFYANSENLGRGKNINSLSQKSKNEWLLILDCDVFPKHDDFINNYIKSIKNTDIDVVFGGICYKDEKPSDDEMLRWIYGRTRESISVDVRKKHPYKSALTSNLLIKKTVFSSTLFNENVTTYGYEDLLFIKDLKEKNIAIHHIENEGYHLNLETSKQYLAKIKIALQNLSTIYKNDKKLKDESKIIVAYNFLKKTHLNSFIYFIFNNLEKKMENHLLSKNPKLRILDFYKLGYFCKLNKV